MQVKKKNPKQEKKKSATNAVWVGLEVKLLTKYFVCLCQTHYSVFTAHTVMCAVNTPVSLFLFKGEV